MKKKQAIEKNLKQTYFTKCLHFLETSDPGNHLEKTQENKAIPNLRKQRQLSCFCKPLGKLISLLHL